MLRNLCVFGSAWSLPPFSSATFCTFLVLVKWSLWRNGTEIFVPSKRPSYFSTSTFQVFYDQIFLFSTLFQYFGHFLVVEFSIQRVFSFSHRRDINNFLCPFWKTFFREAEEFSCCSARPNYTLCSVMSHWPRLLCLPYRFFLYNCQHQVAFTYMTACNNCKCFFNLKRI